MEIPEISDNERILHERELRLQAEKRLAENLREWLDQLDKVHEAAVEGILDAIVETPPWRLWRHLVYSVYLRVDRKYYSMLRRIATNGAQADEEIKQIRNSSHWSNISLWRKE